MGEVYEPDLLRSDDFTVDVLVIAAHFWANGPVRKGDRKSLAILTQGVGYYWCR